MHLSLPLLVAGAALASATHNSTKIGPDADGKYTITGPGIRAQFIPYGASITNLFLNDTHGMERDIVTGWDNASYYGIDKQHPHFGGVPGRYANRIKNSTFSIDGETFHITPNENPTKDAPKGADTLHGGPDGWDWRNWTVVAHTASSISFSLTDPDGKEGFPGEVISYVTYTLGNMTWDFTMSALSTTKKTPIMLSSHAYWNLDGFANPETGTALNHSLWMPYTGQRVDVDNILIPTGDFLANKEGSINDFWSKPKTIGADFKKPGILGNCGYNCTGYDTCYLNNKRTEAGQLVWETDVIPVARLRSAWSGIQVDIFSDQPAFQIYSCGGQNGSVALKKTQGTADRRFIPQYGCIVMEVEDFIDGINHPEWGRNQIYGPGDPVYTLSASYRFSLNSTSVP